MVLLAGTELGAVGRGSALVVALVVGMVAAGTGTAGTACLATRRHAATDDAC